MNSRVLHNSLATLQVTYVWWGHNLVRDTRIRRIYNERAIASMTDIRAQIDDGRSVYALMARLGRIYGVGYYIFRFIWIVETVSGEISENWMEVPEKIATLYTNGDIFR